MYRSFDRNVAMLVNADIAAIIFSWLISTPLGLPVDPLVYIMMAQSFGLGGLNGGHESNFLLIKSWYPWSSTEGLASFTATLEWSRPSTSDSKATMFLTDSHLPTTAAT